MENGTLINKRYLKNDDSSHILLMNEKTKEN